MNERFRITIFPVMGLLLLLLVIGQNWPLLTENPNSVVYTYFHSFVSGEIGSGYGQAAAGEIPFHLLEPGDILLGGWPNCAYGKYSHAGLYLGNGEVLEAYVDYGVCVQPLDHYYQYTNLSLVKVNVSEEIKTRAIKAGRSYIGQTFYPVAFKHNNRYYNCSSIIWKAYQEQGINLDINNDIWVAPDRFRDNPYVKVLFTKEM
ncbi:MAG TPA: YiiX/YebB-like N1pC/P60 family cysteine hydrolase [Syntrophomonas sp.]|nr:YiiX/YebB-like N1pC/P60 family cysteine hydrolase [Syntrophomonas sp.]